jgi:hypothetical protein
MSSAQLFVLVSTRQNIANLPPLLEHANPGDSVLWIESAEARRGQWSHHARRVLQARGLVQLPAFEVDHVNDPTQVVAVCSRIISQHREAQKVYIVTNGGNKLTPLGVLLGLRELRPIVLYGDDKPVVFWTFEESFSKPPVIQHYQRHNVDLPDILQLSGHDLIEPETAIRFWPGPVPAKFSRQRYGCDRVFTRELHAAHHSWWLPGEPGDPVHFDDLARVLPQGRIQGWRRAIHEAMISPDPESDESLRTIYHSTRNLVDDAVRARSRAESGAVHPAASLGECFEQAVALRTHQWLESRRPRAVHSAWYNVRVGREDRVIAQFDVLLVLKNGILWHLECKTFTTNQKDLDARLFTLQRAGSQLARMAVCAPLLTQYMGEEWFAGQQELRELLEPRGQPPYLPFTLPGQPIAYNWPNSSGTSTACQCPTFEDGLARLLHEYEP